MEALQEIPSIVLAGFFIALVFLIFWIVESIKAFRFNLEMGKIWKAQEYKYKELHKCPECGFPQVYGQVRVEGIPPFIMKKYYWETLKCHHCNYKLRFLVKFNGFCGGEH